MEQTITLSPIDQIMFRTYIRWNLSFSVPPEHLDSAVSTLGSSFNQLVSEIPILGGFLRHSGDHELEIRILPTHLQNRFHVRDFRNDGALHAENFAPLPGAPQGTADAPTFAVQVSITKKSIVLCFCMSHSVADAVGMDKVLCRWAAICQNQLYPTMSPAMTSCQSDRARLIDSSDGDHEMLQRCRELITASGSEHRTSSQVTVPNMPKYIFSLRTDALATLKAEISSWINTNLTSNEWISTHDVMCALVWHSITRARPQGPARPAGEVSRLVIAVDVRSKIEPSLPSSYIGNANVHIATQRDVSDLIKTDIPALATTALAIRRNILDIDNQSIRDLLHVISNIGSDLPKISNCAQDFQPWHDLDVDITSWLDLRVPHVSWGPALGKINKFRRVQVPGSAGCEARCAFLPRLNEKVVEVTIGLRENFMGNLLQDELFRKFVCRVEDLHIARK